MTKSNNNLISKSPTFMKNVTLDGDVEFEKRISLGRNSFGWYFA